MASLSRTCSSLARRSGQFTRECDQHLIASFPHTIASLLKCWKIARRVFSNNVVLCNCSVQTVGIGNGDGIDVDSSQHVLIEHNFINCGDDHVTILSGVGAAGIAFGMPSKNITVRDNRLGTGMGLSVGSSVSGGVEDVLYTRNYMNETAGQWGLGQHTHETC